MRETVKRKTYNLDEELIGKVRRLLNVKTDTEAIQKALQKTVEDQEIQESLDKLLKEGRFRTLYRREMVKGKKLVLLFLCAIGITTGALLSLGGCATGSPEEYEKILKATAQWEREMKEQKERQEELKRRQFH